jgi:hypothetical protein
LEIKKKWNPSIKINARQIFLCREDQQVLFGREGRGILTAASHSNALIVVRCLDFWCGETPSLEVLLFEYLSKAER